MDYGYGIVGLGLGFLVCGSMGGGVDVVVFGGVGGKMRVDGREIR